MRIFQQRVKILRIGGLSIASCITSCDDCMADYGKLCGQTMANMTVNMLVGIPMARSRMPL